MDKKFCDFSRIQNDERIGCESSRLMVPMGWRSSKLFRAREKLFIVSVATISDFPNAIQLPVFIGAGVEVVFGYRAAADEDFVPSRGPHTIILLRIIFRTPISNSPLNN